MQDLILVIILLILGVIFAVLVYLVDRVRAIEKQGTSFGAGAGGTSDPNLDPHFAALSPGELWEGMTGKPIPGWTPAEFDLLRPRFGYILGKHIQEWFIQGRRNPTGSPPKNTTLAVRTLRGVVHSSIPESVARQLFELGVKSVQDSSPELRSTLDKVCGKLYRMVNLPPTERCADQLLGPPSATPPPSANTTETTPPATEESKAPAETATPAATTG